MRTTTLPKDLDKQRLIQRLSAQHLSLMFFYEEVPEQTLSHEIVGENRYVVHPPYDYKTLEHWVSLGNWQAIYPANRDYQPFDTFKAKPSRLEQCMSTYSLALIIDSFHDDTEWHVIGDF